MIYIIFIVDYTTNLQLYIYTQQNTSLQFYQKG